MTLVHGGLSTDCREQAAMPRVFPGYDAVFSCPVIPTDSAQLLAAVATGSTALGSSRSELTLQPVCRCLPDCAYPFGTSLYFMLNYVGGLLSATHAAHLS